MHNSCLGYVERIRSISDKEETSAQGLKICPKCIDKAKIDIALSLLTKEQVESLGPLAEERILKRIRGRHQRNSDESD
jgi:hypothetical protein